MGERGVWEVRYGRGNTVLTAYSSPWVNYYKLWQLSRCDIKFFVSRSQMLDRVAAIAKERDLQKYYEGER